ncbi:MAG: hypothetical protein HZC29_00955 [Thaumarchaeota archaeon]|nr:hypothetical protein [Nitrososphaerota archaeon]
MKKYGIQSQIRKDSDIRAKPLKYVRMALDGEELPKARIMISGDLKPWVIYDLLKNGVDVNAILMGTYLVNPYRLPGAVYKIAADQRVGQSNHLEYICKVCADEGDKATLPGPLDVYRIISKKDGKADRDVILLRGVDSIENFMQPTDEDYVKLNQQVMTRGEVTYDLPDMCQLMENTAYHMGLLRAEHKKFSGAVEYHVVISPTVLKIHAEFVRRYQKVVTN